MARRIKREQEEYIYVYYGIHEPTKTVRSVWQTRGGKLKGSVGGLDEKFGSVGPGRDARTEIAIVFGLSDPFFVPVGDIEKDYVKRRVEELKAKAAASS